MKTTLGMKTMMLLPPMGVVDVGARLPYLRKVADWQHGDKDQTDSHDEILHMLF
jgi:hypothetical protein